MARSRRRGAFTISQILGGVAVLFIGLALFGSQNALTGMMQEAGNTIIEMLGTISTGEGISQKAIASTEALSYAISCTGILNARSPDATESELQPLRDAWAGPATPQINTPCSAAAGEDGVTFTASGGGHEARVTCAPFDDGPGVDATCQVHNFTLPQANVNEGLTKYILGHGTPQHIVYYQSLPQEAPLAWQNLDQGYNALAIGVASGASLLFNIPGIASSASGMTAREFVGELSEGMTSFGRQSLRAAGKTFSTEAWQRAAARSTAMMTRTYRRFSSSIAKNFARTRALGRDLAEVLAPAASAREAGDFAVELTQLSNELSQLVTQTADDLASVPSGASKQAYRDRLDDTLTPASISPTLRQQIDDDVLDQMLDETKEQIARKWAANDKAVEASVKQFTGRTGTLVEGGQIHNALRAKFFKQIVTADEIGNQIVNKYAAQGLSGGASVTRRMVGNGVKRIQGMLQTAAAQGGELAIQNAKRVACSAPGITSAAFVESLAETRPNTDGGVGSDTSGGFDRFWNDVKEGGSDSLISAETWKCAAYSGGVQNAMRTMCGDVGVPIPDFKTQGQYGSKGIAACMAMTAFGSGIQEATVSEEPHRGGSINSLYLYNPEVGRMEFKLNKWANFYFVAQGKEQEGFAGDTESRFFLASPFQTDNLQGSDAVLEIQANEIRHTQSGYKRAEGPESGWCDTGSTAANTVWDGVEDATAWTTQIFESYVGFGGFESEQEDLIVSRQVARENDYMGSFPVPEGYVCDSDIVYTKNPILGRKITASSDELQSPPGTGPYTLAGQGQLDGEEFENTWSSYLPIKNPRSPERSIAEFEQLGGWFLPSEINDFINQEYYSEPTTKFFEVRPGENLYHGVIPDKYLSEDGVGTAYHLTGEDSPWLGEEFSWDVDSLIISVEPEETGSITWQTQDGTPVYGYSESSSEITARKWTTYISGAIIETAFDSCVVGAGSTGIGAPIAALCGVASAGTAAATEVVAQELKQQCYWPTHECSAPWG